MAEEGLSFRYADARKRRNHGTRWGFPGDGSWIQAYAISNAGRVSSEPNLRNYAPEARSNEAKYGDKRLVSPESAESQCFDDPQMALINY